MTGVSQKIKNPNQKSSGFIVGIIALIAIVVVVIGAVVWMGRSQADSDLPNDDVNFALYKEGDVIRLASEGVDRNTPVATVYEDLSCGYCAQMATEGHNDELEALNNGDLIVEYRTMNFLDRDTPGHSTRALAVLDRIADTGDAKLFWNYHTMLMNEQQQAARWDDGEFADRADRMGADSDVVEDIRNGLDLDAAFASGNAANDALVDALGDGPSSPHVIVDGKDILPGLGQGNLGQWVRGAIEAGNA